MMARKECKITERRGVKMMERREGEMLERREEGIIEMRRTNVGKNKDNEEMMGRINEDDIQ